MMELGVQNLLERLRSWPRTSRIGPAQECHEAADEIEALRAELSRAYALLHETEDKCTTLYAEVERLRVDAERYHYIRDNHETRDQAMEIVYCMNGRDWDAAIDAALAAAPTKEPRPCTCHPDDKPPSPCVKKYAFAECLAAAPAKEQE